MSEKRYRKTGIKQNVIEEIRNIARECGVCRVLLFGSRARGDFKERSDIDLAVSGGKTDMFSVLVDEETPTLLQYDIVNLDRSVQAALRLEIEREGIVIYEEI